MFFILLFLDSIIISRLFDSYESSSPGKIAAISGASYERNLILYYYQISLFKKYKKLAGLLYNLISILLFDLIISLILS